MSLAGDAVRIAPVSRPIPCKQGIVQGKHPLPAFWLRDQRLVTRPLPEVSWVRCPFGVHRVRGPVGLAGRIVRELVSKTAGVVTIAGGEAGG